MTWHARYTAPSAAVWQGRPDAPARACFFQIIEMLDINQIKPSSKPAFALLGFCSDEGIKRNHGRPGANNGPRAIREMLAALPIQKKSITCYDAGDIHCHEHQLEEAQENLSRVIDVLLRNGYTPIVLGGGHELAYGHFLGITKALPDSTFEIVNFDAHLDMRPLLPNNKGSSGTPFLQMADLQQSRGKKFFYNCVGIQSAGNIQALFDTAREHDVKILLAEDFHQGFVNKCQHFFERIVDRHADIYLSLCMDVFAQAYAPGVSAPQPLGLTPWQVIPVLRQLVSSGKVRSYDIAELSPPLDTDHRTAKLAASLIYEIVHHHRHYPRKHYEHSHTS